MGHILWCAGYLVMAFAWCFSEAAAELPVEVPHRVAFFYGYPSLVNGAAGHVQRAADTFAAYDIIVLGDGVEFPTVVKSGRPPGVGPIEHQRTKLIIQAVLQRKPHTQFFGYVCLGDTESLSDAEIKRRIRLWKGIGASGIFFDEAGYDWRIVTRKRQNAAIQYAHSLGLTAFMNAYYPDSLLGDSDQQNRNPLKQAADLQASDTILLESFPIKYGVYESGKEWRDRLDQALRLRNRFGTRIVALSTSHPGQPVSEEHLNYACWNAWMFDFDGIAWSEPTFSTNSKLPEGSCQILCAVFAKGRKGTAPASSDHLFWRETSDGIVVLDTERKTISFRKGTVGTLQEPSGQGESARQPDVFSR
jgi:hypothetical protein